MVECRAGEANPAPVLEWELNHAGLPGQVVDSVLAGQGEGAGWLASSAATWQADRVPQVPAANINIQPILPFLAIIVINNFETTQSPGWRCW